MEYEINFISLAKELRSLMGHETVDEWDQGKGFMIGPASDHNIMLVGKRSIHQVIPQWTSMQ